MDLRRAVHDLMSTTINNNCFIWRYKVKKIIETAHNILLRYVFGIFISVSFVYWYNRLMPMDNWLTYTSAEPLLTENKIGEEFFVVTTRSVKRQSRVRWLDVLICNNRNIYWRYSAYISEGNIIRLWDQTKSRLYDSKTPTVPSVCYIESTTTLVLNFGIDKHKTLTSKEFYFVK